MLCLLFLALIPFLVHMVPATMGQLAAEYLDVKLRSGNPCPRPYYDGEDTIFLFGGYYPSPDTDIWKFSIPSETLQKVGNLPGSAIRGTVQSDPSGNIFYFGGGYPGYKDVYKFDPQTNTATTVATLPDNVQSSISLKYNDSSDTVFILGGIRRNELWSFDMATLTTSIILTNLTFSVTFGTSVRVGNKAHVFAGMYPSANREALELDLDTFNLQLVGPPTLPHFHSLPSSVWDGTYAYVVGGYDSNTGATDGLIQFDPITLENTFIPVANFPVQGPNYFHMAPASIFVPSRNRIYFFGGESWSDSAERWVSHNDIFYIDLTPMTTFPPTTHIMTPSTSRTTTVTSTTLNKDLFACRNRPNGLHPHPTDCSLYIGCQNEEMTVFSCSSLMVFDPETKSCKFSEVECDISGIDRPD